MTDSIQIQTQGIPEDVRSALLSEMREAFGNVEDTGEVLSLSHDVPTWIEIFAAVKIFDKLFEGFLKEIGAGAAKQSRTSAAKSWENVKPVIERWPHDLYHILKAAQLKVGKDAEAHFAAFLGGPRTTTFSLDLSSEESFVGRILLIARAFNGIKKAIKHMEAEGEEFPCGIGCAVDTTGFTITWLYVGPAKRCRFNLVGDQIPDA